MPKRARSKLAAPVPIISMAQHAKPNVAGHTLFLRAHLTRSSSRPVRKLWLRSSSPICLRGLFVARCAVAHAADTRLGGAPRRLCAACEQSAHAVDRAPV